MTREPTSPPFTQMVGPLFMRRYFMREPITDGLIEAVVDSYLTSRPDSDAADG